MKKLLAASLGALGLAACGTGAPQQWAVAGINQKTVAGANAACGQVPDKVTKTFNNNDSVYTIYQGDGTHYYLAAGSFTLEGTNAGGTYTFSGQSEKDTTCGDAPQPDGSCGSQTLTNPQAQTHHSRLITVTLTPDGSKVKGSFSYEEKIDCTNLNGSQACTNFGKTQDCLTSADLQGTKLDTPDYVQEAPVPAGSGPDKQNSTPGT